MAGIRLHSALVLVVDDESLLRKRIAASLEKLGADVAQAATLADARHAADATPFDFVLLDVHLPDGNGLELLRARVFGPGTSVVVMTGEGGIAGAVEAMRLGAADYLTKPFELEELPVRFERARRARQQSRAEEHRRSHEEASDLEAFYFGPSLAAVEQQLERILDADRRLKSHHPPVLIEGATGTGKTTIARRLHRCGPRGEAPLIEVNCSALPESLAESELFGHERGAFTDAKAARIGLFEAADGGTLFLDELPSLAPALQAKLLSAIEDHAIRRVGANRTRPVDVRLIAATNADLSQLVREGRFREDLFHRLDLFRVRLPPLRERGADIIALAERLVASTCRRYGLAPRSIPEAGRRRLLAHRWPGNVRELAHEIERAVVFASRDLNFADLPPQRASEPDGSNPADAWLNPEFVFPPSGFVLEDAITRLVERALAQAGGNVSAAARLLGVSRDFVRYRLRMGNRPESSPG